MRLAHDHVRVRVPATSANLGPGFDALGIALGLHDEVEVRALAGTEVRVEVAGEGTGEVADDDSHLVARALRTALEHVGAPLTGLHLRCRNALPHGRGLGSSAAAVVAGLVAARALLAHPELLDDATLLDLATQLEGHPDNAAPALLGGATIAWVEDPGRARAVRLPVHEDVVPVVLVPTHRCATRAARGVLPPDVPHRDAAFTVGRAALLVHALCHDPGLLLPATADRLHQDHRAGVLPDTLALVRDLRTEGAAAVVSGAGPSVLVLERRSEGDLGERRRTAALTRCGSSGSTQWRTWALGVDTAGATAERLG